MRAPFTESSSDSADERELLLPRLGVVHDRGVTVQRGPAPAPLSQVQFCVFTLRIQAAKGDPPGSLKTLLLVGFIFAY